MISRIFRSFSL